MFPVEWMYYAAIFSGVIASWVIRALFPFFWRIPVGSIHLLNPLDIFTHEIDNIVYIAFVGLFFLSSALLSVLFIRFRQHKKFISLARISAVACTLYALCYPSINMTHVVFNIVPLGFLVVGIWAVRSYVLKRDIPQSFIGIIMGGTLLKYLLPSGIFFDIGADPAIYTQYFYLIAVCAIGIILYGLTRQHRNVVRWVSRIPRWVPLVVVLSLISLALLRFMLLYEDAWDMFITFGSAYHIAHGGIPFIDVYSQYGYGYLIPWILWILAFPKLPVSYEMSLVATMIFLVVYFGLLTVILYKLFASRLLALSTTIAVFFYTILIRYWGFPGYKIALVGHPAFTPLRFGACLIPLGLLMLFIQSKKELYFTLFLIASTLGLFFSVEIGAGLFVAALALLLLRAVAKKQPAFFVRSVIVPIGGTVLCSFAAVSAYTLFKSGRLPDIGMYTYFARFFGGGVYLVPIGGDIAYIFPLFVSLVGVIAGMYAVLKKRDVLGIACVYIAVIQLTSFPYYMGRSMPHTLYGVSMPFIIVAGLLVDLAWKNRSSVKKDYVLVVGTFLCLFIIVLGALRGTLMMIPYGVAAASIGKESSAFIQSSINHWNTKDLPEYQFLVKHLPSGCPLLSVDAYEFDLLAALGVAPATQYAYVRGYIVSTEQIDTLKPKLPFCFFINQSEFNAYDTRFYYVYHILWEKASKGAQLIAEDSLQGFRLYKVTSWQ